MLAPACARKNTAKTTVPLPGASEICELRPNAFACHPRVRSFARGPGMSRRWLLLAVYLILAIGFYHLPA